jgi:ArsR family transcriptional regulator
MTLDAPRIALPPDAQLVLRMGMQAETAAALLKALGHAQRLMILCHLSTGPKTVTEIEVKLGARQAAVSQHLARLRLDGLVSAERDGKSIIYDIADPNARAMIDLMYALYCKP